MGQVKAYSPLYDWLAAEIDFKAGILTLAGVCYKHGMSLSRLQTVAAQRGWVREERPDPAHVYATDPRAHQFTPDEARKHALLTAVTVVEGHRGQIASLRRIADELASRLSDLVIKGEVRGICLGARETPADMLRKLTEVTFRVVNLERQAFGLTSINPEDDSTTQADGLSRQIARLTDDLDRQALQKAELVDVTSSAGPVEKKRLDEDDL